MRSRRLLLAFATLAVLMPRAARAQSAADRTLAETLFRDGKKLMDKGSFAEACPKLAESQRLDPGGGTLLNLARCHEGEGKTATAWAEYADALALAKRDGHKVRIAAAEAAIAKLEPALVKLTIVLAPGVDARAVQIKLDGAVVPAVALGAPSPVDPGNHVVVATAPARKAWESKLDVRTASQTVTVPALEAMPSEAPAPPPPPTSVPQVSSPPEPSSPATPVAVTIGSSRRTVGLVVAGVGLVGVGVGSYLALHALSLRSQSDDGCQNGCTPAAVDLNRDAKSSANLANVGFGVGIVGLAVGAVLIFTGQSPSKGAAMPAVVPVVGRGEAGVGFSTGF